MEAVDDILREMRARKLCMPRAKIEIDGDTHYAKVSLQDLADRIEAAHRREVESYKWLLATSQCALEDEIVKNQNLKREVAELEAKLSNTETARKFFARRLDGAKEKVEELRDCLRVALASEYGRCSSRWPCALCSRDCKVKRWRKALKGANHEGK